MKQTYTTELEKFSAQLEALVRERAEIDNKIHRVKQIIQGIAGLEGIEADELLAPLTEYENRGLASSIKAILQVIDAPMTAAQIRQGLIASGHELTGYANASSVINTVLNRFAKKGLVTKALEQKDGQMVTTYEWVTQLKYMKKALAKKPSEK
jgi:hypothetical protein